MADEQNNKFLVERSLDKKINQIFRLCRLGEADWDLNESLRQALLTSQNLPLIADISKSYDKTYEFAKASNLVLDRKYSYLYQLKS